MRNIEDYISPLVETQFPQFFQEEGPLFVLFAKEYFKWLETNNFSVSGTNVAGKTLFYSRNLFEYRDIDKTIDEFYIHFKEKYLKGITFDTLTSKTNLIKAAHNLFGSKGTERSFDLLFKLLYGTKVEIYNPGQDILKASDGVWIEPVYLEVTRSYKTPGFAGKQITGSESGTSAFAEYVITRTINDKVIDIIYLSGLNGSFQTGEIITTDGIVEDAPKVTGSLSLIELTTTGQDFTVGEIVNVVSARGIEGKARVTSTFSETGLVRFSILDGGWGYSANATTDVSDKVISLSNITNSNTQIDSFEIYELVSQNLFSLSITNFTGNLEIGEIVTNVDGAESVVVKTTPTADSNAFTVIINPITGNQFSNTIIYAANQAVVVTNNNITFNVGDVVRQNDGSSNVSVGIVSKISNTVILTINATPSISANGLHIGTFVKQATTNATGIIAAVARESNFGYTNVTSISLVSTNGTFNNTSSINVYPSSTNTTFLASATPNNASNGFLYYLSSTHGTARWSTSNTILLDNAPTINNVIRIASDVGGNYTVNASVVATGNVMGQNSTAIGLNDITNTFYATNNSILFGVTSNTFANLVSISTGQGAAFRIGSLSDSETVLLSPDMISGNNDGPGSNSISYKDMLVSGLNSTFGVLSSVYVFEGGSGYSNSDTVSFAGGNTGTGSFQAGNATINTNASGSILRVNLSANVGNKLNSTPTVTINTSTGTGANVMPLASIGFPKLPLGDLSFKILDLLRFESRVIGSISTLTGINPGENYNKKPFVLAYDPLVAPYGKRDIIINIDSIVGGATFIVGEKIEQTINSAGIQVTSNAYSGNTSNLYTVGEQVLIYNGASQVGAGLVYSSTYDAGTNNHITVLVSNTGTIANTYYIIGQSSNSNSTIINTSAYTASAVAKGTIKEVVSNTVLKVKRLSLFTDFIPGNPVYGKIYGVSANLVSSSVDIDSRAVGDNAVIDTNVITSNGSISGISVVASGFGYENNEGVNLVSEDGERIATGKAKLIKQGIGEGYYASTRGFLDSNKYIHDGSYYQEYSYEIQTGVPFEKYSDMLKQLLHVSGTKMFGKMSIYSLLDVNITANSNIEIS